MTGQVVNPSDWELERAQVRKDRNFRLGVGSFREECTNYVEIIHCEWQRVCAACALAPACSVGWMQAEPTSRAHVWSLHASKA